MPTLAAHGSILDVVDSDECTPFSSEDWKVPLEQAAELGYKMCLVSNMH